MIEILSAWVPDAIVARVAAALLHFVWQGALIALGLALVLWMLRDRTDRDSSPFSRSESASARANLRYLVSCLALLLMSICPVVNLLWTQESVLAKSETSSMLTGADENPYGAEEVSAEAGGEMKSPGELAGSNGETDPFKELIADKSWHVAFANSMMDAFANAKNNSTLLRWLFVVWIAGVVTLSVWHVAGWWISQRFRSQGEVATQAINSKAKQLAKQMVIARDVLVRTTEKLASPMVLGVVKPIVIVPSSIITGLTSDELEAVLAHELAHVKRHDYVVNLLQSVVETLLFYHPAVWWVSRRIRIDREFCADDLAMRVCSRREVYVQSLVNVAELVRSGLRTGSPRHAIAATGGSLLDRVRRLMPNEKTIDRPHAEAIRMGCYSHVAVRLADVHCDRDERRR